MLLPLGVEFRGLSHVSLLRSCLKTCTGNFCCCPCEGCYLPKLRAEVGKLGETQPGCGQVPGRGLKSFPLDFQSAALGEAWEGETYG